MQINFYFAMITLGRNEVIINKSFLKMKCHEVTRFLSGVISRRHQALYLAWIVPHMCELQASAFLIHLAI